VEILIKMQQANERAFTSETAPPPVGASTDDEHNHLRTHPAAMKVDGRDGNLSL
jgi:hypothetical protein